MWYVYVKIVGIVDLCMGGVAQGTCYAGPGWWMLEIASPDDWSGRTLLN